MTVLRHKARTARDRLVNISHHFLSDQAEAMAPVTRIDRGASEASVSTHDNGVMHVGWFHLGADDDFPVFDMCQQLTELGRSVAICECGDSARAVSFMSSGGELNSISVHEGFSAAALDEITLRDEGRPHDAWFLRLKLKDGLLQHDPTIPLHHIVLVVPVAIAGSRKVQDIIEQIRRRFASVKLAAIMSRAPEQRFASKVFSRLAASVKKMYGIDLHCYGVLQPPDHVVAVTDGELELSSVIREIDQQISRWRSR